MMHFYTLPYNAIFLINKDNRIFFINKDNAIFLLIKIIYKEYLK